MILCIILSACTLVQEPVEPASTPLPTWTAQLPALTSTAPPPAPTLTLEPTAQPAPEICSPLAGFPLEQLREQVSNPYNPPRPGSDDPHQGVDLAELMPGSQVALTGMPVQAVLSGRVAGVTRDRFPYGNMLIIETALDGLQPEWVSELGLPEPINAPLTGSALSCPAHEQKWFAPGERSLYLLYAHLLSPPAVQPGDAVACGDVLGAVGQSGNALSPHLHLEVRVGPANADFGSMAHYDPSASVAEMGAYCLWRVSGAFQTIDPFYLLTGCQPEGEQPIP